MGSDIGAALRAVIAGVHLTVGPYTVLKRAPEGEHMVTAVSARHSYRVITGFVLTGESNVYISVCSGF